MRKWVIMVLFFLLSFPLVCQGVGPGSIKERMGTLSGQVFSVAGEPLHGGVVSFFNSEKGIPPLLANMHRIPDMVGRMGIDGKFSVKLLPGSYYMGAMVITDPGRGPGPPQKGETFYFARDDKGNLRDFTLEKMEVKDAGHVIGALPDTFSTAKNLTTIEGRLLKADGNPFIGGVVLVKTSMNKPRPDFVSARTGEDGTFSLKLPAETDYYLLGRERAVGRPAPGSYVGTYGSNSAISEGGALPIGGTRPSLPASGMPPVEDITPAPASGMPPVEDITPATGNNLPVAVKGKAGLTLTGLDIMMFKVPVPGEQRKKLQGTLGFGNESKAKIDTKVPLDATPAKER